MVALRAKPIHEMSLIENHGLTDLPTGLEVRSASDAFGRPIIVVNNAAHRAFSIPAALATSPLPDWFLERIKDL